MKSSRFGLKEGPPPESQASRPAISSRQLRSDMQAYQRSTSIDTSLNEAARHKLISMAAYYKAEQRGFAPGHQLADWLAAEAEFEHSTQGFRG